MFFDPHAVKYLDEVFLPKYPIQTAVETGTYHGEGTLELAKRCPCVITCETNGEFWWIAAANFEKAGWMHTNDNSPLFVKRGADGVIRNIYAYKAPSPEVLQMVLPLRDAVRPVLFYLDAHWEDNWPILDELKAIAEAGHSDARIIIHDFKNPQHPEMSFDSYKKQPLDIDFVRDALLKINPKMQWWHNQKATRFDRPKGVGILYAVAP